MSKHSNELTPVETIMLQYPTHKKDILKCMNKWHKMTKGKVQWPVGGTFDLSYCEKVEEKLKDKDKKNGARYTESRLKNAKHKQILQYFQKEGAKRRMQREAFPPPYNEEIGQYPLRETTGRVTGVLTVEMNKEPEFRGPESGEIFENSRLRGTEQDPSTSNRTVHKKSSHSDRREEERNPRCLEKYTEAIRNENEGNKKQRKQINEERLIQQMNQKRTGQKTPSLPSGINGSLSDHEGRKQTSDVNRNNTGDSERESSEEASDTDYTTEEEAEASPARHQKDSKGGWARSHHQHYTPSSRECKSEPSRNTRHKTLRRKSFPMGDDFDVEWQALQEKTLDHKQSMEQLIQEAEERLKMGTRVMTTTNKPPHHRSMGAQGRSTRIYREDLEPARLLVDLDLCHDESEGPMTLRSGKRMGGGGNAMQCPLLVKGPNNEERYVPWGFMDLMGLINRLPALTEGADKWITAFEENTGGIKLAIGDMKALLLKVVGQHTTDEIYTEAGIQAVPHTSDYDSTSFDRIRTRTWDALRAKYPSRMDPSKLERECLKDDVSPLQFLHEFQRKWKNETGSEWNANESSRSLFMMYVKNAMPKEVQNKLNGVVGLMKLEWPIFSEHIVHYVDVYRAEKRALEEQNVG